jgi:hypothetical protein
MRRPASDPSDAPESDLDAPTLADNVVRALVRAHGAAPPYEGVDWDALTARVLAAGRYELETQHQRATGRRGGFRPTRATGVRAWWQVAAGWIGPAALAAAAVGSVAGVLATGATGLAASNTGDETAAASASVDARSDWQAALDGRGTEATRDAAGDLAGQAAAPAFTRDSLYDAVVTQ